VVGLGNPDRGDDGVGALVVERLKGRLPAAVALAVRRADMLALIEDWARFDAVLCVDAAAPCGSPGRVERLEPRRGDWVAQTPATSSHALGLAEAVELAAAIGIAPKELIVYAIEGDCFEPGAGVTAAVAAAAEAAAQAIVAEVERWCRKKIQRSDRDA